MKYSPATFFFLSMFLIACNNDQEYNINDRYENGKSSVEQIEKKDPARFLAVSGSKRKNLLNQTVVKGNIFNNGKLVRFKDIELLLSFYSKTGTLLEQDHDVIYETISPGESTTFKSKYFAPKGTDSVGLRVLTAKF